MIHYSSLCNIYAIKPRWESKYDLWNARGLRRAVRSLTHFERVIFLEFSSFDIREMATKNVILSFERDSKTINRSLLQNFYTCFTSGDIPT